MSVDRGDKTGCVMRSSPRLPPLRGLGENVCLHRSVSREREKKRERVIWQCRWWCCFASEDKTMRRTDGEREMQMATEKDCRERNGVRGKENDKRWMVPLFDNVPDRVHSDSLTTTGL